MLQGFHPRGMHGRTLRRHVERLGLRPQLREQVADLADQFALVLRDLSQMNPFLEAFERTQEAQHPFGVAGRRFVIAVRGAVHVWLPASRV